MSFLNELLPSEGLICVAEQLQQGFKHHFVPNVEAAQIKIDALDAQGKTVFVAQASFKTPESRKGENAHQIKNFFLDIDCGVKKPYATQKDGILALGAFCNAAGLPVPSIVNSGNGLYAHWTLDRSLPANIWKSAAEILKQVIVHYEPGLDADGLVADRARVLRPVGATHRKDPLNPKTVKLLKHADPVKAVDFIKQVKAAFTATGEKLWEPKKDMHTPSNNFLAGLENNTPSSAEIIATKCAQIANIRMTRGNVSEPLWYSAVGLLRYTTEGRDIVHEWSQGHPDYSPAGTDAKIEQHERANIGPTTCDRFCAEGNGLCEGCQYAGRIKSPITLGYAAPKPLTREPSEIAESVGVDTVPVPPTGFTISDNGIYYNDGGEQRCIYPYPIWFTSINVDHFGESITVRHRLPHDGEKEFTLASNKTTEPRAFFSALIDNHVHVIGKDNKGLFMYYAETFMGQLRQQQKLSKLSGQMGWHEENDGLSFIHGAEIYRKDGSVQKVGYSATAPDFVRCMRPQGDSSQWIENTRILNQPGLEGLAFEFLCGAFGAPLVRFTGYEGAMVSVVGDSGLGKTLTGKWALSAWGDPKKLILMRDDTRNAMVGRLGVYGSLPAYIDEVSNIDPKELSEIAYRITQGREKTRLTKSAIERSNINHWNTLAIVSSNHSLSDKLSAFKGDAGAEHNRIFEYELMEGYDKDQGYLIANACDVDFGVVGKEYALWLVKNQDLHKDALLKIATMLDAKSGALPDERFWTMTGAVAIYGGMIARNLGVSHVNVERLVGWVVETIKSMRKYKKANGFDAVSFVGSMLDRHANAILVVDKDTSGQKLGPAPYLEPRGSLIARIELADNKLWVSYDAIKRELQKIHISGRKLAALLADSGLMETSGRKTLGGGTIHQGISQYCWKFDLNNPALGHVIMSSVRKLEVERKVA